MHEYLGATLAFNLAMALVALVVVVYFSAWLDRRALDGKGRFSQTYRTLSSDPLSLGIYLAARWLGACLLVGFAFLHV